MREDLKFFTLEKSGGLIWSVKMTWGAKGIIRTINVIPHKYL